jgi:hypothetical protein
VYSIPIIPQAYRFPILSNIPSATTSKLPLLLDRGFGFGFQFPLQGFSLRICSLRFCLLDSLVGSLVSVLWLCLVS